MIRPNLALLAIAVLLSGTRAVDAGLNFVDHFTVVEDAAGSDNFLFAYGPNSITGPSGQHASINGALPTVVGNGASQMVVVSGTGSLTAPTGYTGDRFSIYRWLEVEMTSDFDLEYNVTVTENGSPSQFRGSSWSGSDAQSLSNTYDLPSQSSGSFSALFSNTSPDFSGTPTNPNIHAFEFAANVGSVFNSGPIPFDAPLDFDFDFELKFTPTSYVDTNGDGVNDNFGPAFAVPEPSSFLLLSLLGLVGMSGKYFRRAR